MKYAFTFILALLVGITVQAQHEETRNVSGFNEIHVGGSYNVYISQGDKEEVRLVGNEELIEDITVEVNGDVLKISKRKGSGWNWNNGGKTVKIYITYRNFTALRNSGSNDVYVKSKVQADEFKLTCSGSGDVEMAMDVNSLSVRISGSSNLELEGRADEQSMKITGSGDIEALNLVGKSVDITISGSGDVAVHATDSLEGSITGSGDIAYRGTPSTKMRITGSGDMRQVN